MKKIIGFFIFVAIFGISCDKAMPVALFSTDKSTYVVDETISITNLSSNGDTYVWLAGSQTGSDFNFNPSFDRAGTFQIKLTVINGKGIDEYSKTVTITETSASMLKEGVYYSVQ